MEQKHDYVTDGFGGKHLTIDFEINASNDQR